MVMRPSWRIRAMHVIGPVVIAVTVVVACSTSNSNSSKADHTAQSRSTTTKPTTSTATSAPAEDFAAKASDFVNLKDMTPVRGFFISNKLGHLKAALAVADSKNGGHYPVGTIVQLFPGEAMVKRRPGFDPKAGDWEFFELDTTAKGTTIHQRGGAEIVNRFGGSCSGCHSAADPKFDFICEKTHGCAPLPIGDAVIKSIQDHDPRPRVLAKPVAQTRPTTVVTNGG